MNDVIRQIEEVKKYFDKIMFSPNSTEADFIKAALTVLQKMAAGDLSNEACKHFYEDFDSTGNKTLPQMIGELTEMLMKEAMKDG